jgi:serine/threonine-protein kinase RsbW
MKASIEFAADRDVLPTLETFATEFAERSGLPQRDLFVLQLVIEELVLNVIDHGGVPAGEPAGAITLTTTTTELIIEVTDHGAPYNPLEREAPDVTLSIEEREIGGLGVHLCMTLTDSQSYARVDNLNVLTLRRSLTPSAP